MFFSRDAATIVTRANLPHWSQRCACFVTFRLADALPREKLAQFSAERDEWLAAHPEPWNAAAAEAYHAEFDGRMQEWLDAGSGACLLRLPEVRLVVEDALRHFDGIRYSLYAYVVMPNHVHILFMPMEGFDIPTILHSWKSYTAKAINKVLRREGAVWQKESWDRMIRNARQFNATRSYIVGNDPNLAFDAYR